MKNTIFLILKPSDGNLLGTDQGSEDEHLREPLLSPFLPQIPLPVPDFKSYLNQAHDYSFSNE